LLATADIRRLIEILPEPMRSIVVFIVLGSMRVGEVQKRSTTSIWSSMDSAPPQSLWGLPPGVDFRSFRTMHSSLMGRVGARPEVIRDNMGHATIDVTQNVYGKSWWDERVEAVSKAAAAILGLSAGPSLGLRVNGSPMGAPNGGSGLVTHLAARA
jgi:hypothetical protein